MIRMFLLAGLLFLSGCVPNEEQDDKEIERIKRLSNGDKELERHLLITYVASEYNGRKGASNKSTYVPMPMPMYTRSSCCSTRYRY